MIFILKISKRLNKKICLLFYKTCPFCKKWRIVKHGGDLVKFIGFIPVIYGLFLLFFGPDHLLVDIGGPSFWQFIMLHPGAPISVGVLIIWLGRWIKNSGYTKVRKYIDANYKLCNRFGRADESAKLVGTPTKDGKLVLQYRNIKPAKNDSETESKDSNNFKKYD